MYLNIFLLYLCSRVNQWKESRLLCNIKHSLPCSIVGRCISPFCNFWWRLKCGAIELDILHHRQWKEWIRPKIQCLKKDLWIIIYGNFALWTVEPIGQAMESIIGSLSGRMSPPCSDKAHKLSKKLELFPIASGEPSGKRIFSMRCQELHSCSNYMSNWQFLPPIFCILILHGTGIHDF